MNQAEEGRCPECTEELGDGNICKCRGHLVEYVPRYKELFIGYNINSEKSSDEPRFYPAADSSDQLKKALGEIERLAKNLAEDDRFNHQPDRAYRVSMILVEIDGAWKAIEAVRKKE